MRYLLVLLLAGCATQERISAMSNQELCAISDDLVTNETYRMKAVEVERRNLQCLGPAGFAYPPTQQIIVVNPN